MIESIRRFRAFLVDVDGTLIHGPAAVPGTGAAIVHLRDTGRRIVVTTNNSLLAARELSAHLRGLGIPIGPEEIVSTVDATASWLAEQDPGAPVYVVGSPALKAAVEAAGLEARPTGEGVRHVVVGGDRTFDYEKLTEAVRAILAGARFVATNRDGLMIEPTGVYPGGGAVVGAIVGAVGRDPDVVVGKPSTGLFAEALKRLALPPEQCAVVGDNLVTDVATAHRCGLAGILVLTGVTTRELLAGAPRLEGTRPDFVLDSLADLAKL